MGCVSPAAWRQARINGCRATLTSGIHPREDGRHAPCSTEFEAITNWFMAGTECRLAAGSPGARRVTQDRPGLISTRWSARTISRDDCVRQCADGWSPCVCWPGPACHLATSASPTTTDSFILIGITEYNNCGCEEVSAPLNPCSGESLCRRNIVSLCLIAPHRFTSSHFKTEAFRPGRLLAVKWCGVEAMTTYEINGPRRWNSNARKSSASARDGALGLSLT